MIDINKFVWNIKESWKKIYKNFDNVKNYINIFDYIKNAKNIWIIGHNNIDWDSLGSVLAIQRWLKNKFSNKKISAYTNRAPWFVFDFLNPEINFWEDLILEDDIDLFIVLDSANFERLWQLYQNNKEKFYKTNIINIDHHISNTKFWKINIVDETSSSTSQIIYEIILFLENKLNDLVNKTSTWFDEQVANYILMWILTDTQVFMLPSANERTLYIAGDLLKKWADKKYIIENIFQNKIIEEFKFECIIFDRMKIVKKNNISFAYSYYNMKDLDNLWIDKKGSELLKWIVNKLVSLKWIDFVCLWKIEEDKTFLSFRSTNYDVNQIALKFGWWWHKNASWVKIIEQLKPEDIEKKILDIL